MNWYAVHVMTGKEEDIMNQILKKGIKAIVPKRIMRERKNGIWHNKERVLMQSYVFVYTDMTEPSTYYLIRNMPGLLKILGDPTYIREEEITLLLRLTQDGDPLGLSEIFVKGGKIIVTSGPLIGLEGRIIKIDARRMRAKANIELMGEPRVVELGIKVIKKSED